jgi:hypothetical protein
MPVIGMTVNKRQKEELKAIVREMCLTQFAHPQDPNILSIFLPPGAGVGTDVSTKGVDRLEPHTATPSMDSCSCCCSSAAVILITFIGAN